MLTRYTCPNGVRVVLEKIPHVRSAAIGIFVNTGSRHEPPDLNGISHFLEHMFFKGTESLTAREIAESFDRIGGQVNAFTTKEYTCFYAKVLDNHAIFALDILTDMFFNSTFDEEELIKEKNVVYEEIKMYEDTPDDIVHDLLTKAIFGNHPLGYPILGTEDTLATFTKDMLKEYMYNTYTPDKVVISIAGNVDDALIYEVEKRFGYYEGGKRKENYRKPVFHKDRLIRTKETEQAHLCIGFKGYAASDQRIYPLIIVNNILGGSMSSRLFQEIREERGLAYSVYSYHSAYEDTGTVTIYGGTAVNQLDILVETIFKILDDLKQHGVTEKELENSKEQIKGNLVLSTEGTGSRMSRNGKNELLLEEHKSVNEMIQIIDRVTIDEVNDVCRELFTDQFSLSLIAPDEARLHI